MPVIPLPDHVDIQAGTFVVHDGDRVLAEESLAEVSAIFMRDVGADSGLALAHGADDGAIRLELDATSFEAVAPASGVRADGEQEPDERYGLRVSAAGIRVWAATPEGIHRGLTTLRQLISRTAGTLPQLEIIDGPRFNWRGLSLDVARRFHDVRTVMRVIDMCSLYKLNVLHLHLTDDQGWRVPVRGWPALTADGSQHYSRDELDELVAYAAARFITVVPEVDMPGHVSAALAAYPELRTGAQLEVPGMPAVANLDPANDHTWNLVRDVVTELAERFPTSRFIHIGGDEAFAMSDDTHVSFVDRARAIVTARGRRVIGWQEIARAAVTSGDVVQYWMEPSLADEAEGLAGAGLTSELMELLRGTLAKAQRDIPLAVGKQASVLLSPTGRLYFDRPFPPGSARPEQEAQRARLGLPVYPPASLRDGIAWEPGDELSGVDEEVIVGIEAAVWCETVQDGRDLEFLLLPRLCGAAEKAWAGRGVTDWGGYSNRLSPQAAAWSRRGWSWFRSLEIEWPEPGDAMSVPLEATSTGSASPVGEK
jgi:hexosaminidase